MDLSSPSITDLDRFPIGVGPFFTPGPFAYGLAISGPQLLEELRLYVQKFYTQVTANETELQRVYRELADIVGGAISNPAPPPFGFYVLSGLGIDQTGSTYSTAAVQAFLDGVPANSTVHIPSGAIIAFDGVIHLHKPVRLTGSGELRWTANIAGTPAGDQQMIDVASPGCTLDGLYLTNPGRLYSNTGGKSVGIAINASHTRVHGCRIEGQQNAILAGADGEWHDIIITDNDVIDVPGGGAEDRGDGIVVMGAAAVIANNRVSAIENSTNNCRIGVALEGLAVYEATPYLYGDSMCVIANNVVTGPFKRSITSEGVAASAIVGNTVSGSTVWGINLVNTSEENIVADNTITMRYTDGDTRGNDLGPIRCGILVYDNVLNADIHDNVIRSIGSGRVSGIAVQQGTSRSSDVHIHHNTIDGMGGVKLDYGIFINNGSLRTRINDNTIKNFALRGIQGNAAVDVEVCRNVIVGSGSTTKGMHFEGDGGDGRFDDNSISLTGQAMELYFRSGLTSIRGNRIKGASTGVDTYGLVDGTKLMFTGNIIDATTKYQNVPTNGNTVNANNL